MISFEDIHIAGRCFPQYLLAACTIVIFGYELLKYNHRKKAPSYKIRLRRVGELTFGQLVHQINSLQEVLKLR